MGQRHQLFAIAKIGNRFRSLAALHHQWLYGQAAIKSCAKLITIFQEQKNHPLLRYELQLAATLPQEKWEEEVTDWQDQRALFPFIATCLMFGASFDPSSGTGSNVAPLPFNTPYDGGDNNDGVTILDITDPSSVRYAFVFPELRFVDSGSVAFRCTPLTGAEYACFYSPRLEGEDVEEGNRQMRLAQLLRSQKAIDTVLTGPSSPVTARLIDDKTLDSAWPGTWYSRAECELPVDPEVYNPPDHITTLVNSTALQEKYEAFQRADEVFASDYVEEFRKYHPMPIKQIIHVATNEDTDDETILQLSKTDTSRGMDISLATLPLDDTRLSSAAALQGLYTWIHSLSFDSLGMLDSFSFAQMGYPSSQSLIKSFGLDGPDFNVVKPVPATAFRRTRDCYHSSIDWLTAQMEDIKPCEWTIIVHERWERHTVDSRCTSEAPPSLTKHKEIEIGFVTRRESSQLAVVSAREFHEELGSKGLNGEALAWSNDEGFYGKELIEALEREGGQVGEIPITAMGVDRARCIIDACVTRGAFEKEKFSVSEWLLHHRADYRRRAKRMEKAQSSEETKPDQNTSSS
ncbi:hypothetical protein GGR57DRAFT_473576 [Xylariaceae sp. FL1272]|nr:hypothetical protein GGR57DRAFT_473576 [Xylariaceae sp. FL1272]